MSVDERLRSALKDQAETFLPAVETALDRVHAEGRAARWRTAAVGIIGAAATVAVVGGAVVWLGLPDPASTPPTSNPSSSVSDATPGASSSPSPLRGTISAEVSRPATLAGMWRMQLHGNGTMDVEPPAGYAGDIEGALFTADSSVMQTTLFHADLCAGDGAGIYEWLEVDGRIHFDVVSDRCAQRLRLFEKSTWVLSTAPSGRG